MRLDLASLQACTAVCAFPRSNLYTQYSMPDASTPGVRRIQLRPQAVEVTTTGACFDVASSHHAAMDDSRQSCTGMNIAVQWQQRAAKDCAETLACVMSVSNLNGGEKAQAGVDLFTSAWFDRSVRHRSEQSPWHK